MLNKERIGNKRNRNYLLLVLFIFLNECKVHNFFTQYLFKFHKNRITIINLTIIITGIFKLSKLHHKGLFLEAANEMNLKHRISINFKYV